MKMISLQPASQEMWETLQSGQWRTAGVDKRQKADNGMSVCPATLECPIMSVSPVNLNHL